MNKPTNNGDGEAVAEQHVMTSLSPLPPDPYGLYTVIGKLGHGRLAQLLLGIRPSKTSMPELVVIKRLHRHLLGEEEFVEAFLDEVRIAVKLNHPNVVRTYDHGKTDGDYYFVMEHLEGQGLDRIVRRCAHRGVALPPELVAIIGIQALEGLHYAHELRDANGTLLQVVHRDIRPPNIFVTYDGTVKLLDFGIAKAATKVAQSSLGTIKGKYSYTSPEQIQQLDIDRRSDIWSMGVVLWEALASRPLFAPGSSTPKQLAAIVDGPIPNLVEVEPSTPKPLAEVIRKALRRDTNERFQTSRAMAEQLKVAIEGIPEVSHPRQEPLRDFMTELFSDVMIKNRSAISQCLQGKRVSGEYNVIPPTSSLPPASKRSNPTERFTHATMTVSKGKTERKFYLILAAVVAVILFAAVGLRFWAPWE